jgi:MerR family transcriptional regulator, thiopeptide resistance regulator
MERPLTPAETARRFGVSIKALRLYEQHGLLTPLRSRAGSTGASWRSYGPDQIARLHQILALKRLGFSLARIGALLKGPDTLKSVLALQEQALAQDHARVSRALNLVRAARAKLNASQVLSIDDLANLTKETVMTRPSAKELNKILAPFGDQHFTAEEKQAMGAGIDREQVVKDLDGLMAEAQVLMQIGDPTSPAAQDLSRRWVAFAGQFMTGGADVRNKGEAVWKDALDDPATAEKLALHREIFRFVEQAIAHLKSLTK